MHEDPLCKGGVFIYSTRIIFFRFFCTDITKGSRAFAPVAYAENFHGEVSKCQNFSLH